MKATQIANALKEARAEEFDERTCPKCGGRGFQDTIRITDSRGVNKLDPCKECQCNNCNLDSCSNCQRQYIRGSCRTCENREHNRRWINVE